MAGFSLRLVGTDESAAKAISRWLLSDCMMCQIASAWLWNRMRAPKSSRRSNPITSAKISKNES
jgi:hypothetical protein